MADYHTQTSTFTVIDIRKTFENFEADLRMIARRTGKWEQSYVEKVFHDILCLAESHYLKSVDITLLNENSTPVKASRYTVSTDGRSMQGDRAGGNNWPNISETYLTIVLRYDSSWHQLNATEQQRFQNDNNFKIGWVASSLDTSYSHLKEEAGRNYSSKTFELKRQNFG